MVSSLAYFSTHRGHTSSEIPMHHCHYCKEVQHLYCLLLQVVDDVAISLVSAKTGFLVTHSRNLFVGFLGGFPLEPVYFDLHYFFI